MFKLFSTNKNNITEEVYPENGVYIVYELVEYKFQYFGKILEKIVFIEDEVLEPQLINYTNNEVIETKTKSRIFQDYFGYLTLSINREVFNFEVRIQKLKVPELEDILLYLWNQDPIIFNNFFSKSTLKARLDSETRQTNFNSKILNIFDDFYSFFKNKYFSFRSLPHYVLRTKQSVKDYDNADISSNSVEWLINNLDELHIDYLYKNVENAIEVGHSYGITENILTEEKVRDLDVYENQIILGAFDFINQYISDLKSKIEIHIPNRQYQEKDYYSIDEFRIIPFLKLLDDLGKVENRIKTLWRKYQVVFKHSKSRNAYPKLTAVFINKKHYSESFKKIKQLRDSTVSIEGELNLINIRKISTLYERFNLFVLVNTFLSKDPTTFSRDKMDNDNVFKEFYFHFPNLKVSLYYDTYIGNNSNEIGLCRISPGYYKPDYIIKVESSNEVKFYILDSKYSAESTVRHNHLQKCIKSYILDLGILGSGSKKVEELLLVYPGNNEDVIYGNDMFKPKIGILPSKVNSNYINIFIEKLLRSIE